MFNGQTWDAEAQERVGRFRAYMDMFLTCTSKKNGDFLFLPFPGGYLDQPAWTLTVLRRLQQLYSEHLAESFEKATRRK